LDSDGGLNLINLVKKNMYLNSSFYKKIISITKDFFGFFNLYTFYISHVFSFTN